MIKRSSQFYKDDAKSSKEKKILTKAEAYQKATHFCAYQERTQGEVRQKLQALKYGAEETEELISMLIVEGFINEERFAKAFAGGKFRMKKWGRNKIRNELKNKKISDYCIRKGMAEIDDKMYIEALKSLAIEKNSSIQESNEFKRRHKVAAFLIGRGFEQDLVWDIIRENI